MKKKFTEEQYQVIVEVQRKCYPDSIINGGKVGSSFKSGLTGRLYRFITNNGLDNEAAALANPLTRDWAYGQFVEPEKKYYWRYKKKDDDGDSRYLKKSFGLIELDLDDGYDESFTEKEIIEAGYNPDMFVKEEPLPF